jgi:hypothetical protein
MRGLPTCVHSVLVAAFLSLAGCERGALMNWLLSLGAGEGRSGSNPVGSLRLNQVDCPAGLVRCVDGVVELAQAYRHADPCQGSSETCSCPWQFVGRCDGGCVSDGLAVSMTAARAAAQLCSPGDLDPSPAVPQLAANPPTVSCGDERFRCTGAKVIACAPPRFVASCIHGCAEEDATLDEEGMGDSVAVNILCAR